MVYVSCIDKKVEKGNIIEYKLKDFEGNIEIISAEKLKGLISDGVLCVANLTLTSDNKLRSHNLMTLKDINKSYKSNNYDAEVDIKNIDKLLPSCEESDAVSKEASTRSLHFFWTDNKGYLMFYVTKEGKLKYYNGFERKEIGSANRKYLDSNIVCIQRDNIFSIFVNYETTYKKRNYVGLEHILYDVDLDTCTATEIYDKRYSNIGLYVCRRFNFNFNVNNVIPLFEKCENNKLDENLHPLFLLYNKNKSCVYKIDIPSKGAAEEVMCKFERYSKSDDVFEVQVQPSFGVDLSMGPYTISIDRKTKSGRVSKDM